MNTNKKHKSKNKSKPISEKSDVTSENEQNIQVSVVESVPVEEIVKEIVSENVITSSDKESEPKKPKRNKNKKKQGETPVKITEVIDIGEKSDEKKNIEENKIEGEIESLSGDDFITPTARKKKNKHKKSETQGEIPEIFDSSKDAKEKSKETIEIKAKNQDIPVSPLPEESKNEQENKSSKKKNKKKKNRSDSERSDKTEEAISCTAAFQKLLEPKVEKLEVASSSEDKNINLQKIKDIPQTESESETKKEESLSKSKKKSKKGKVVMPNEDNQSNITELKQGEHEHTKDYIETETCKLKEIKSADEITNVSKVPSPKPKAKIAKPVERKNKNKSEESDANLSSTPTDGNESIKIEDLNLKQQVNKPEPVVKTISEVNKKSKLEEPPIQPNEPTSQTCIALSQILDIKEKQPSQCLQSGDIEPLPDKGNLEEFFLPISEEHKTKVSKADKKHKNKSDNQAATTTQSSAKPLEVRTDTSDFKDSNRTKVTQEKEKSPNKFEDLIKITSEKSMKCKELSKNVKKQDDNSEILHADILAEPTTKIESGTVELKDEGDKQTKTSDKKVKSPIKRNDKEQCNIREETLTLDDFIENTSLQHKEIIKEPSAPDKRVQLSPNVEAEVVTIKPEETLAVKPLDKKRKKSPMKHDNIKQSDISAESITTVNIFENISQQGSAVVEKSDEKLKESMVPEHICQIKETENVKTSAISNVIEMCNLNKDPIEAMLPHEELQLPTQKNKKRKKSPKPPQTTKTETYIENMPINVTEDSTKSKVEERHAKEESERKTKVLETPDHVPDSILYPRSLSQLIEDTNYNASIREIKTPEKCNIGLFDIQKIPIIEGSGASPTTPEAKSVIEGPQIIECLSMEKEKTDLKSKVLEVNKDMEVLRLSIERTLAGLTQLEEKDKELEKSFKIKKDGQDTNQNQSITAQSELIIASPIESKSTATMEPMLPQETENIPKDNISITPPVPARQDKGKGKSKKKNQQESQTTTTSAQTQQCSHSSSTTSTETKPSETDKKKSEKTDKKSAEPQQKGKQSNGNERPQKQDTEHDSLDQHNSGHLNKDKAHNEPIYSTINNSKENTDKSVQGDFDPIENFEDAMTSSIDDVNKSFEIIANESNVTDESNNPEISITGPEEDTQKKDEKNKINPVSQPKNLLGHPDIPVPSNRTDYKKEKNKFPNARQARVKIKDSVEIETAKAKESKESQTESRKKVSKKDTTIEESVSCVTNENEEYVYKYSFRRVFLPNICHICKKELKTMRVPCNFCSLIFYCSEKHKDEGWPQHQGLCFAVSTVAHHKGQKHIYADAKNIAGHDYRLFRMQTIVACEKVLKRRLVAWEQEMLLYPRICADPSCREYRQSKLKDCAGCGQISYCLDFPDHLPKVHQRWCKSYNLYHKLVHHQQTIGRLSPKLPTKVLTQPMVLPDKVNMVLASLYEEKIDMNDIQYAALTQIATAPLTAAYGYQLYGKGNPNIINKPIFTIHLVGAELQYEADALNKWETLFLHLKPEVNQLNVVMIGASLNPSDLPLDLLGKVKLCADCRLHARQLIFHFQDKKSYYDYWDSNDFLTPDIVCAFNPSIHRATIYNGRDHWPTTISTIFKQKCPFIITSYTMNEINRDLKRIKECSTMEFRVISEAKFNPFASVRPDRNFITDDEIPLLFKNFCFAVLLGD